MKKIFQFLPIALLFSVSAYAQYGSNSQTPVTDNLGNPIPVSNFAKIKGSPYVYDDWVPGQITNLDGKTFKGLMLKFDESNNLLTFIYNKGDEPQRFATPVKIFTLYGDRERVFASQFPKIDGLKSDTYYEVIAAGKTMLLKHNKVSIRQTRDDNNAPVDGRYAETRTYYIFRDNKMARIKPNREQLLAVLNDKAPQLKSYIDSQKINFNNEDDLKKLITYYNGL